MAFRIIHKEKYTRARVGIIHTLHGDIQTPAFVPVGTQATVKSLTPDDLVTLGTELFFVNTYHAYLRPGVDVIKKFGGLHRFMGWDRPLITDSGGFQVFSLGRSNRPRVSVDSGNQAIKQYQNTIVESASKQEPYKRMLDSGNQRIRIDHENEEPALVKITDEGVEFRSHWDGTTHRFTPEVSIEIQHILGADLIIAFDECTTYPTTHEYAKRAMERTHRWAARSLEAHKKGQNVKVKSQKYQALYGVVQGSVYEDLRHESADFISANDFDGIAIGGVSVGESKEEMRKVCDWVVPRLPDEKPRHLLGVGEIDDIFDIVERGIDTFDCVQPTRLARMGRLLLRNTPINQSSHNPINKFQIDINKTEYKEDMRPIEENCTCYTCTHFSRAYIHHLFRVRELLGYRLTTIHNLHFVHSLVTSIRRAIIDDRFLDLKREWLYDRE